jgi:5-methyltetrahydropteroyltriglutamate--homocysteine methyltransferase
VEYFGQKRAGFGFTDNGWVRSYGTRCVKPPIIASGTGPETRIHAHARYSDFSRITRYIDAMDDEVVTFEASRSNLEILDRLAEAEFGAAVGPGVYGIHSPRVPSVGEIEATIESMLSKLGKDGCRYDGLWVNPDCGLNTRPATEAERSPRNLVEAVKRVRHAHRGIVRFWSS